MCAFFELVKKYHKSNVNQLFYKANSKRYHQKTEAISHMVRLQVGSI